MPEEHDSSGADVLALDADLVDLERLRAFIDGFCGREGLSHDTRYHLTLALEELVVNAIKHGGCRPGKGAIRLTMRMEGDEVRMTLCDTGIPFDPLQAPPPDLGENVLRRPVGGLGIHLVRCLIPGIRYHRAAGRNWLYLTKPVKSDSSVRLEENTDAKRNGDHQG